MAKKPTKNEVLMESQERAYGVMSGFIIGAIEETKDMDAAEVQHAIKMIDREYSWDPQAADQETLADPANNSTKVMADLGRTINKGHGGFEPVRGQDNTLVPHSPYYKRLLFQVWIPDYNGESQDFVCDVEESIKSQVNETYRDIKKNKGLWNKFLTFVSESLADNSKKFVRVDVSFQKSGSPRIIGFTVYQLPDDDRHTASPASSTEGK